MYFYIYIYTYVYLYVFENVRGWHVILSHDGPSDEQILSNYAPFNC